MVNFTKYKSYNLLIITILSLIILLLFFHKNISHFEKSKIESLRLNEESGESEEDKNNSSFDSQVNKICKKASSKLQKYYETYDKSIMDFSSNTFEEYEFYPDYIRTIFNLIEGKGEIKDNILTYLYHAAASFMFIIFGIISIVAWIFFGFFCCCNCCCCCCCKKEECKTTFLFLPLLFDLVIIISCVAGIFSINKMFRGLSDVECSLMKFISEINTGEKKENDVKWLGFEEIGKIFEKIKNKINEIKTQTESELNSNYEELTHQKEIFPDIIEDTYENMLDPDDPDSPLIFDHKYLMHIIREDTIDKLDIGVIDVLYNYGPMKTDDTFLFLLNEEYTEMRENADQYLERAHNCFENILTENSVNQIIDSAFESIKEINTSINDIKDTITQYVTEYSETIESYGKYIVKIIYVIIISLACFSAFSVVMMYITAIEYCYGKCCCGKGLTKTLSHIAWNLMSLVAILSFVICGVVFLISYLGKDLVKVITIIVGQYNLYSRHPILIKGNVSNYFNVCLHGDGDLGFFLGLTNNESSTYDFDELKLIMDDIIEAKKNIEQDDVVIKNFKESLENRKNWHDVNIYDFNTTVLMNLDKLINNFNNLIKDAIFDVWTLNYTCPEDYELIHCPENESLIERKNETLEIKECLNFQEWKTNYAIRYQTQGTNVVYILHEYYNTIIKTGNYYVNAVNNITDYVDNEEMPLYILEEKIVIVEDAYREVINAYKNALNIYNKTIYDLVSVFDELNKGGESLFSFLNCRFIANNVFIILNNLQGSFAGSVQSIGITLVFASFGMIFSIIFTILEIVILNVSLYLQKRRKQKEEQITLALGMKTKVLTFMETGRSGKGNRKKAKINNFETQNVNSDN